MDQNYEWMWAIGVLIAVYLVIKNLKAILIGVMHLTGVLIVVGSVGYVVFGTGQAFEQRIVAGGAAFLLGVWLARSGPPSQNSGGTSTRCGACGGSGWMPCTNPFCPQANSDGGVCTNCMATGSVPCTRCHGTGY